MVRIIISIDGMACENCEAAVTEALTKTFAVQKVKASFRKNEAEVIAEAPLDEAAVKAAIHAIGFTVTGIASAPYEKKSFNLFK